MALRTFARSWDHHHRPSARLLILHPKTLRPSTNCPSPLRHSVGVRGGRRVPRSSGAWPTSGTCGTCSVRMRLWSLRGREGYPYPYGRGGWDPGSLPTYSSLLPVLVWMQDICLKMAFMKSVAQVTSAIKNIKDLEDFQFGQKTTLTAIVMVSWAWGVLHQEVLGANSADWLPPCQRFQSVRGHLRGQGATGVSEAPSVSVLL